MTNKPNPIPWVYILIALVAVFLIANLFASTDSKEQYGTYIQQFKSGDNYKRVTG